MCAAAPQPGCCRHDRHREGGHVPPSRSAVGPGRLGMGVSPADTRALGSTTKPDAETKELISPQKCAKRETRTVTLGTVDLI